MIFSSGREDADFQEGHVHVERGLISNKIIIRSRTKAIKMESKTSWDCSTRNIHFIYYLFYLFFIYFYLFKVTMVLYWESCYFRNGINKCVVNIYWQYTLPQLVRITMVNKCCMTKQSKIYGLYVTNPQNLGILMLNRLYIYIYNNHWVYSLHYKCCACNLLSSTYSTVFIC